MQRKLLYILLFLVLSLIGHSYIIYRFLVNGVLFTGPNDGMEQMVPIKMFLFENWSHGNWFYSTKFGLGGDFFTDLSYYFSTNLLFIFNVIVIVILKFFIPLQTDAFMFWITNDLVVSIIKATVAMIATFLYMKYIALNNKISILTAFVFVISPLYFRFTVYWPFFSDVFILLPLLLLSIERALKKGHIGLFIVIVTITLVNNFYFAYYQLLTGLIYFGVRLIFQHKHDILSRGKAFKLILIAAVLGLCNSLFFFYHSLQSYLNNRRIPFHGHVDLFEQFNQNTNVFYDNYLIVVLFITIQALLSFKLYKHYYYRIFALLTIVAIVATFLPFVDQLFNGFSAPQKRWHYLLAFTSAVTIGLYVKYFRTLHIWNYMTTSIIALLIIFLSAWYYHDFVAWLWFAPIIPLIGMLILLVKEPNWRVKLSNFYIIAIILLAILVSFVFTRNQIFFEDHVNRANRYYANSSLFNSNLQRNLVNTMNNQKREDERIDWRVNEQDNTPMYQHFKGMSVYSSIFDHNILDYYYDDLKINLKEESVSRYQSTNGRQNIASLFSEKYLMLKSYQSNVPNNFKKIKSRGQYQIYENTLNLPSVRVTNKIYNAKQLTNVLDREHAMIDGVVMQNKGQSYNQKARNLLNSTQIKYDNINSKNNSHIELSKSTGRIQLQIPENLRKKYKDFYIDLLVKRGQPDSNYLIDINGYTNNRLYNNSTYRTGINTQLYKTKPDKYGNINITFSPSGNYIVNLNGLYGEDYQQLKSAHETNQNIGHYKDIKNGVKVKLNQHKKGIATINIPYREGMTAYIKGQKVKPFKVNYMMTGVKVSKDSDEIVIKYRPKFWFVMFLISFVSITISALWGKRVKNIK
ncbi:YfhO family protein [Staphylococcus sp. ACRSN]|uniref:YfhO family protein n=1 Tax=Staphylococcus sp. ACRSN TaxID=2918214 RepID=UPI001EF39C38|nr:YfhO family protein [Staphylococcus sp. ACRSN]MCG7338650.1 YfhO family protein [Staphylococcus sp. ACRSN]